MILFGIALQEGTVVLRHQEWSPRVSYDLPAKWEGIVRQPTRKPAAPAVRANDPFTNLFDDLIKSGL